MELINLISTIVLWGLAIYFSLLAAGIVLNIIWKFFEAFEALLTGEAFKDQPPKGR